MILRQLILKQMIGTESPGFIPTTPIAVYNENELETLLSGDNPEPEGIRFHFDRASGGETVGLVAVCLILVPIGSTMVRNFELSDATKKYQQRGATSAALTAEQFRALPQFTSIASKGGSGNQNVCVFFSKLDLRRLLDQPEITRIAFFPASIQRNFTGTDQTFESLVAIGQTSNGTTQGLQLLSELPCPPHCGDDYP